MTAEQRTRDNPGLKLCLWPKAFVHAAQTVVDHVFEEALNEEYRDSFQSSDVYVTNIVKPTITIAVHPGELTWMLDNASLTIQGQIKNQYGEENFEKHVFGSADVSITVVRSGALFNPTYSANANTANLRFSFSSRGNGFNSPSIFGSSISCSDSFSQSNSRKRILSNVTVNVSGNFGEPSSKRSRNEVSVSSSGSGTDVDLEKTLIRVVLERLNHLLPDYSFPLGSSGDWMFNFSEPSMPQFQNGYLESIHLAAIYYNGDTVMVPTQAAPFPEPQNSNRMLTIFISNYVINTIGYCFHREDILNYNLTQADLIPQATEDDSTTDTSVRTRSLSDCFPGFSVKYPGASVEVNMASSEAPTSTFSGQHLKVTLLGSAVFRAHLEDDSFVDFLTTEVNVETTVLLKVNMGKLTGTVTSILPRSITVVKSALESVNREVLKEAIDLIATQFLSRKFEEITQKGIPLPSPFLSEVEEFESVEMWSADDFLRIDTDLKFHV